MTSDVSLRGHGLNFYLHYNTTYKLPFTCSFLSRDFLRRKIELMVHQELPIEDLHRAQFGQIYREAVPRRFTPLLCALVLLVLLGRDS